jgi:hypothetical protein
VLVLLADVLEVEGAVVLVMVLIVLEVVIDLLSTLSTMINADLLLTLLDLCVSLLVRPFLLSYLARAHHLRRHRFPDDSLARGSDLTPPRK